MGLCQQGYIILFHNLLSTYFEVLINNCNVLIILFHNYKLLLYLYFINRLVHTTRFKKNRSREKFFWSFVKKNLAKNFHLWFQGNHSICESKSRFPFPKTLHIRIIKRAKTPVFFNFHSIPSDPLFFSGPTLNMI